MLTGLSGEHQTTREMDSNAIKLEENRGVYWLPGMVTETLNGVATEHESRDGKYSR